MISTTTPYVQGRNIAEYKGIITGEAILGANIFRDFFAGITDIIGGRAAAYENELRSAREIALREMESIAHERGADAVVGVDIDYEYLQIGKGGGMLMVTCSGTAVRLESLSRGG